MTKLTMTNECTSSAGRFDGHGDTDGIAQCGMTRATPEATGCRHRATSRSILPQRLPGQHANKQQSTNTPTKLVVSMAIAMRRYDTARITRWRRTRASLEATGCHHRASTCSDSIKGTCQHWFCSMFFIVKSLKRPHKHKDSP